MGARRSSRTRLAVVEQELLVDSRPQPPAIVVPNQARVEEWLSTHQGVHMHPLRHWLGRIRRIHSCRMPGGIQLQVGTVQTNFLDGAGFGHKVLVGQIGGRRPLHGHVRNGKRVRQVKVLVQHNVRVGPRSAIVSAGGHANVAMPGLGVLGLKEHVPVVRSLRVVEQERICDERHQLVRDQRAVDGGQRRQT
ncbi:hypothetical protein CAOG_009791 [Capsaspora owczarzaki ATCC 30864]|uniref:Uncharacterized protein n=1 Tax=Capsaspora owczarzaki (strain ATCC 30864) TaxID=595528 RepID=A0A0D2X3C7_CAPO3|nr:hypothetical protein CAOG_009791 [Capsaspora owczarzaki ATCC 30864]